MRLQRASLVRRLVVAIAVLGVGSLATAGTAAGQAQPPSEIDQYVPGVPGAEEEEPLRDEKEKAEEEKAERDGQEGSQAVPPEVVDELETQGATGESAAGLAEATAPDEGKGKGGKGGDGGQDTGEAAYGTSSPGTLASAVSGESDDGMGWLLPLLLAGVLAAGIAYAVLRRRRAARGQPAGPDAD